MGDAEVKTLPANAGDAGDLGLIPGSGRFPGEGNDNLLQHSCLENPMDSEAWWATVHGVAEESDTTSYTCMHTSSEKGQSQFLRVGWVHIPLEWGTGG